MAPRRLQIYWRWKSRRGDGRPTVPPEIRKFTVACYGSLRLHQRAAVLSVADADGAAVCPARTRARGLGSDRSHGNLEGLVMPKDDDLLDMMLDLVPNETTRNRVLVQNPSKLHGF